MDADALIGTHIFDAFASARQDDSGKALITSMTDRCPTSTENFYQPWKRWFEIRNFPLSDGGVATFFQDVTERKNAEASLRAAAERDKQLAFEREAILNQLVEGVIVTDECGIIKLVNEAAAQLHGVRALASGIASPLDRAVIAHRPLETASWTKVGECPFDFERRRVSVLLEKNNRRLLVVKGAPEDILALSTRIVDVDGAVTPLDRGGSARLTADFEKLGEDGYRVLAVATKEIQDGGTDARSIEKDLTFAGFLAFVDPPKSDAALAIRGLAEAGVSVKIVSGDNERITLHVCREIGIEVEGVLTGSEIDGLSDEALRARLVSTNIFCRVLPQQKARILTALKRSGHVVGFLGDGINDASALGMADVGISVDTAADVAKEAADLVLLDRNLNVILEGVREGRRTVENVMKYILMGSSSNLGNMMSMAGAAVLLPFLPMLPTQVLLNNLLYDLSEIGVPFDRVDPETVSRPLRWDLGIIKRFMLILGPLSSVFDFLTFWVLLTMFGASEQMFQSGWFMESLATQTLVVLVIRTRRRPWQSQPHPMLMALSIGVAAAGVLLPFTPLGAPFRLEPLPPLFYLLLVVTVAAYLVSVEFVKQWVYKRDRMRTSAY